MEQTDHESISRVTDLVANSERQLVVKYERINKILLHLSRGVRKRSVATLTRIDSFKFTSGHTQPIKNCNYEGKVKSSRPSMQPT